MVAEALGTADALTAIEAASITSQRRIQIALRIVIASFHVYGPAYRMVEFLFISNLPV